jgi:hypothetical protein
MNYLEEIAAAIKREIPGEDLPDADTEALFLAYATLALSKGTEVTNEDVHDAWVAWMTEIDPGHDSLVPYDELPSKVKEEDSAYTRAIKKVASRLQR